MESPTQNYSAVPWRESTMSALKWRGRFYDDPSLSIYDVWDVHLNMKPAWGADTMTVLLPLFLAAFTPSRRHLDIGVATGYFPSEGVAHARLQNQDTAKKEIVLMDITEVALMQAKQRIEKDNPVAATVTTFLGNALAPAPKELKDTKFDSVSMFDLIHCLPGAREQKSMVFSLAADMLADDGFLVGCTVLGYKYLGWGLFVYADCV